MGTGGEVVGEVLVGIKYLFKIAKVFLSKKN